MYKHLYDHFEFWQHGGSIYFYSDPHFNDEEMKYLRQNYIGDEEQVRSINKVVGKKDTIVFLGDIGDLSLIPKIRGYKILIMGNHDKGASNYLRVADPEYDNHLFDEVYEGPLFISDRILLSHEPIDLPYVYNIHGHTHDSKHKNDKYHFNVCAEKIGYTPISLKSIIESGALKEIPSIHRMTIDKAAGRK